tara:strand:- start:213 stop:1025 length:813 start_codon:yes stop_codon:yes gene_type:complete
MKNIKNNFLYYLKKYGPKNFFIRKIFRYILKTVYSNGIEIRLGNKYRVKLIVDYIGYISFGDRHNKAWSHCIDALKPSDVFFDIGAHIGLYTLPSALKLKFGKVHAFEPGTYNLDVLKKHVNMNSLYNVQIHDYLVGQEGKNVDFYENLNSMSPKNSISKVEKIDSFDHTIKRQISLDEYFLDKKIYPDVIKIDVEGSELLVLRGATRIIKQSTPKIYLSVHPLWLDNLGQSVKQLKKHINELDYTIYDINMQVVDHLGLDEYILLPNSK